VTVHRTHDDDVRQRQVIVNLDDAPKVTLMFGESFTRDVPPGRHRLRFNNTLVKKVLEFDAAPGEHVEVDVVNHPGKLTLGFLSLLGVAPLFLRIERRQVRT
jgi:hypothetical protein